MPIDTILFDLDGTLIDSSKGILESLSFALSQSSIVPSIPLTADIIGPPLPELVKAIVAGVPPELLDRIVSDFADYYDNTGCFLEETYPHVDNVLFHLNTNHINLHVSTNKRHRPTLQILSSLPLTDYFKSIYSPDTLFPKAPNKARLLSAQLRNQGLHPSQCLYVGDRIEDWSAARSNDIRFAWACWGFSPELLTFNDDSFVLDSPESLVDICTPRRMSGDLCHDS